MASRVDLGSVKGPKGDTGAKGDKGDAFTYDDFTTEQLESLHSGITNYYKELKSTFITTEDDTTTVPINISEYRDGIDLLSVFVNGFRAKETIDYIKSGTNIILTSGVIKGTKIHFVVLRSVAATTEDYDLLKGDKGEKGEKGDTGATGPQGPQGPKGDTGGITLLDVYPIGSIYTSVINVDPSTVFGGAWERIAKGRALVGVDENDTDFNTAEKTGGEKTHQLTVNEMPVTGMIPYDAGITEEKWCIGEIKTYGAGTYKITDNSINKGPHNNLQPYFTIYVWKRTA